MPTIPQKMMACRKLGLVDTFEPTARIGHIFGEIILEEIISCLRTSTDESAMLICAMFDRLNSSQKNAIDIDYLTAAAHCKDVYKIAGLITETYTRVKGMESAMKAAQESPGIMKAVAKHARRSDGYNHAKLVLQTTGVVALPKNQTTVLIGNKIDNSKHQTNVVATHSQVVDEVGDILSKLSAPIKEVNVQQGSNPAED